MRYCLMLMVFVFSPFCAAQSWRDHLPVQLMVVGQAGMYPTLEKGEKIVIRSGFLFSPEDMSRGDVVTFWRRENNRDYVFIWRVIGLPGDTVVTGHNEVILNGTALTREPDLSGRAHALFTEYIGDVSYTVSLSEEADKLPRQAFYVPEGYVFVLGDNRHFARDSRYLGLVPVDAVFGALIR